MKLVLALTLLLLVFVGGAFAAPNVTSWSNNKTSDADVMFFVSTSDVLNFNVTVNESVDYIWSVNKTDQAGNYDNFTYTIPSCSNDTNPSSCIWEIHLNASNANGTDHQEWVVSTLGISEAPDIFDYFTDKKTQSRAETDPWGRSLPEWSASVDASDAFVKSSASASNSSLVNHGTWKFSYKFESDCNGPYGIGFNWVYINATYRLSWSNCADSHHHCWLKHEGEAFSVDYDVSGLSGNKTVGQWHNVTIVRTSDNWVYMYWDDMLEFWANEPVNMQSTAITFDIANDAEGDSMYFDGLEVYENKYLFPVPEKKVEYGEYVYSENASSYYLYPQYKNGIVVKGRNITLSDINESINNASLFTYDANTKTAICYTNLAIDEGAELIIEDETLKFYCSYDGEFQFAPGYASTIRIENSTVSTDTDHYFTWNNAGATTHLGYKTGIFYTPGYGEYDRRYRPMGIEFAYYGRFIVNNSLINNTAHLFFDSPYDLNITNTEFRNLHEIDIGDTGTCSFDATQASRDAVKGDKSFWICTDDVNLHNFKLSNITFSGAETSINVTFMTNAHRDKLNIYDINMQNETIKIENPIAPTESQSHTCYVTGSAGPWGEVYEWKSYIASEIGLVNCKFNDILIPLGVKVDDIGRNVTKSALVKYYLDVKVIDGNGDAVSGATVNVGCEQDWTEQENKTYHYPVENMEVTKPYTTGDYSCAYHHYRVVSGQNGSSTTTITSGHTPLPSNSSHTMVITDYKKCLNLTTNTTEQTNYTYNITVSSGAQTATASGININDSWYRSDPETPTMTIVCNLSTGTCDVEIYSNGNGWSPSNQGIYWNPLDPIEITRNETMNIFSRVPAQTDNNASSFRMEVTIT